MKHTFLIIVLAMLTLGCNSDKTKHIKQHKIIVDTTGYSLKAIDDLHERLTVKDYDQSLTGFYQFKPKQN